MKPPKCRLCGVEHALSAPHTLPATVVRPKGQKAPVTLTPIVTQKGFTAADWNKDVSLNVTKPKGGRPRLSDHKLTPAERKRRSRAKHGNTSTP